MFDKKSLKSTALILCSAFIIGLSNGAAQASAAEFKIDNGIETVETGSDSDLREIWGNINRERKRRDRERYRHDRRDRYDRYDRDDRHRYDRDDRRDRYDRDYPPPPPPR